MKRSGIFLFVVHVCLLTAFLASNARPSFAGEDAFAGIAAEGIAVKTEERADYKKKALQDAHKKAVASAVEKLLSEAGPGEGKAAAAIEAGILPDAASFILTYRVLAEGWLTHMDIEAPAQVAPDKSQPPYGAGVEAYHVRIEAGVDGARLKAAVERIASAGVAAPASGTMTITLVDVPDYRVYSETLASIERSGLVKDMTVNSFYMGRVILSASVKGDEDAFAARLARELSEGYTVMPRGSREILIRPAISRKAGETGGRQ